MESAAYVLRKATRELLRSASTQNLLQQGQLIQNQVIHSILYQNSKHIGVYLHLPSEVPTDRIIADIFASGRNCYVPAISGNNMDFYRIKDMDDFASLKINQWNIREPDNLQSRENPIDLGLLDLIIVPGLVFDKNFHRLGKGKGYYDRYLAKLECNFKERKIPFPFLMGLAFREQIVEKVPKEAHDYKMDLVIYIPHEE